MCEAHVCLRKEDEIENQYDGRGIALIAKYRERFTDQRERLLDRNAERSIAVSVLVCVGDRGTGADVSRVDVPNQPRGV